VRHIENGFVEPYSLLAGRDRRRSWALMSSIESAVVVLVPEAETLVRPFRDRYDPSAAVGMPAHITLLYPFKPPDEVGDAVLDRLRRCVVRFAPIQFDLTSIRRFPIEVLYLAPEPDEPFRRLTLAIWDWFPETPPYGGKWPNIVPHLSVAQVPDEQELGRIADDFGRVSQGVLPICATTAQVTLMDNRTGRWLIRAKLSLRPK
jgi:2'-5' RNA ligase